MAYLNKKEIKSIFFRSDQGGNSNVEANPNEDAQLVLEKIKIDDIVYAISVSISIEELEKILV